KYASGKRLADNSGPCFRPFCQPVWHVAQPLAMYNRSPRASCDSARGVGLPEAITVNSERIGPSHRVHSRESSSPKALIRMVQFPGRGKTNVAAYSPSFFVLAPEVLTISVPKIPSIAGVESSRSV